MRCKVCGKKSSGKYCVKHDKKQTNLSFNVKETLKKVEEEVLSSFDIQKINKNSKVVFGYGNGVNKIVIIGIAPAERGGAITGEPFTSPTSGKLLNDILKENGIKKEDCFISNICFVGLPGNRSPLQSEVNLCLPYLSRALNIIKPRKVILLGSLTKDFFNTSSLSKVSSIFSLHFLHHPSYAIRTSTEKEYKKEFAEVLK